MPMASAAMAFSRTARQALPCLEWIIFFKTNKVTTMQKNSQGKVVSRGIPDIPDAPPTCCIFKMQMRIISPMPSVAMAK